jgi:hypothetical protein
VREDPHDHPRLDDRGDEAHATGADRTLEDVDEEDALQELRPGQPARAESRRSLVPAPSSGQGLERLESVALDGC